MDDIEAARALFDRFRAALESADADAFVALCATDVEPEIALFTENAARLRAAGQTVRLFAFDRAGDVLTLRFSVIDAHGTVVDEGALTATFEGGQLRIRGL